MKKNYLKIVSILALVCCLSISFLSCSSDDDDNNENGGNTKSSLSVDGKSVEIADLEAEYDDGAFFFWVNDALSTDKYIYIQADFLAKENISTETDVTSKFNILFQRNKGVEWFSADGDSQNGVIPEYNSYRSGNIIVKSVDTSKKILVIEFKEAKYLSNLNNIITINGILTMTYKVI